MEEPVNSKFPSNNAVNLKIGGVSVKFPAKPYPSQLSMMSMIIRGLERKQHCLLESPTGSGKSLALLCSSLAWQKAFYDKQREELLKDEEDDKKPPQCICNKENGPQHEDAGSSKYFNSTGKGSEASVIDLCTPEDDDDDFKKFPKLASVAAIPREPDPKCPACSLKKLKDVSSKEKALEDKPTKKIRVPKIWFGTRTHKQIGQITRELGRTLYDSTRMTILSSRQHSCIHPAVMKSSNKNEDCRDLRKGAHSDLLGAKCAFYQNVHRMKNPYQLSCAGMGAAWDLEELVGLGKTIKACPYYSAKELVTSADIIFCPYNYLIDPTIRTQMQINLNNQILILDEAHNIEDCARDAASFTLTEDSLGNTTADLEYLVSDEVKVDDHKPLHLLCSKLGQWVVEHSRNLNTSEYETSSQVWSGKDIIAHLAEWGITEYTLPLLEGNYTTAVDLGEEDIETARVLHSSSQATLSGLFTVLRYLMMEEYKYCGDYRVTIIRQSVYGSLPPKRTRDGWINMTKRPKKHFVTNLHFWCLNPAVAFSDLSKAHSIILTSGTLSPMSSFSSELGLSFPIQLEANHVIKDSQVWVGSLGSGPKGVQLHATYQNTDKFSFQDELGEVVKTVCEVVPHGVLCFFSSYSMMKKLSERWEATGLWGRISEKKTIVCEPRSSNKEEFDYLLQSFYDAVSESESQTDENPSSTGALLLAVCRGKVSEGLDFADNNARAVITVGIPFPSIKDKQVELKRKYNDMHKIQRGLLSGSEWYEIQAYRAMNQALGRCIRHKNDWGALIIVDDRFCKNPKKYCKGLSKWVRQKVHPNTSYQSAMASITAFVEKQVSGNSCREISHAATKETEKLDSPKLSRSHITGVDLSESILALVTPKTQAEMHCDPVDYSSAAVPTHHQAAHNGNGKTCCESHISSDDEDFQSCSLIPPRSSVKKYSRKTKIKKHKVDNEGAIKQEDYYKVTGHANGSIVSETEDCNIIIPASPHKSGVAIATSPFKTDVTIIPESPPYENGVANSVPINSGVVQRLFDGSSKTPSRKRKKPEPHNDISMPDLKKAGKPEEREITDWNEHAKDSEEFPPRANLRRQTHKKNQMTGILCSCGKSLCQRTDLKLTSVESVYLARHFGSGSLKPRRSSFMGYIVDQKDITQGHLSLITSDSYREFPIIDSVWCDEERRCYQLYKCKHCLKLVAAALVSEAEYDGKFVIASCHGTA